MGPEESKDEEDYIKLVGELEGNIQYMLILFSLVAGFSLTILVDLVINANQSIGIFAIVAVSGAINISGLGLGIRFVTMPNDLTVIKKQRPAVYDWFGKKYIEGFEEKKDYDQKEYFEGMLKFADRVIFIFHLSLILLGVTVAFVIVYYIVALI